MLLNDAHFKKDLSDTVSQRIWAIIPAGGNGRRFGVDDDKLLANLDGEPVLLKTCRAFLETSQIEGIVLVASKANLPIYQELLDSSFPNATIVYTLGGKERHESVYNGLMAVPKMATLVAIHDAARPLITSKKITDALHAASQDDVAGSIVALPVYDTLKQVQTTGNSDRTDIIKTLDRRPLWRAQTPQVFKRQLLLEAHERLSQGSVLMPLADDGSPLPITDDAQLIELLGLGAVTTVMGDASNLKITTRDDLLLAEALLKIRKGSNRSR